MLVSTLAACVVAGVAVPGAVAATKKPSVTAVKKQASKAARDAAAAKKSAGSSAKSLAAALQRLRTAEAGLGGLLGATPQIVTALTVIGGAIQNDVAPGLRTLADALQKQIVPSIRALSDALGKQIVPAVTRLNTYVSATEYGIAQVMIDGGGGGLLTQHGAFLTTPDIPDTSQQAMVSRQYLAISAGNVVVRWGIRSAESDGTAFEDPAGFCSITVLSGRVSSTTPGDFAVGGEPFARAPQRSALTSADPANAGWPFGLKTSGADADKTQDFTSSISVTAGESFTVSLACIDPTTTSDPAS